MNHRRIIICGFCFLTSCSDDKSKKADDKSADGTKLPAVVDTLNCEGRGLTLKGTLGGKSIDLKGVTAFSSFGGNWGKLGGASASYAAGGDIKTTPTITLKSSSPIVGDNGSVYGIGSIAKANVKDAYDIPNAYNCVSKGESSHFTYAASSSKEYTVKFTLQNLYADQDCSGPLLEGSIAGCFLRSP